MEFADKNVAEDEEAMKELVQRSGRRAVPVILVGDEMVVGFDRGQLKKLLGI